MKTTLLLLVLLAQASLFFVLPSIGTATFLSPDETANAVSARLFARSGQMRFEEPWLREFPWMHPRSFVTQNSAMVPVGFLGMPIFLGLILFLIGEWGLALVTPLLALSVIFPLWKFMTRFGRAAQIATVITWLSFPTVILYANRGLFAGLPVVCLTVWACFLLWEKRTVPRSALAGLAIGFAFAMRPTEILWIVPWIAVAWRFGQEADGRRGSGVEDRASRIGRRLFLLGAILPITLAMFVAWKTYGSPIAVGYFLRDPVVGASRSELRAPSFALRATSYIAEWPFGFHPRNVLFNFFHYFGRFLWPWTLLAIASGASLWKQKKTRPVVCVAGWTLFALALVYGQAIYQDHVGANVISIGNSFLRYLLPFAVFASLTAGYVCGKLQGTFFGFFSLIFISVLAIFGNRIALFQAGEGVVPAARELRRYAEIRNEAVKKLGTQTIILSERSDKIFFPIFHVASPLPSQALVRSSVCHARLALFTETRYQEEMGLKPIFQNKNQTLYTLLPTVYCLPPPAP